MSALKLGGRGPGAAADVREGGDIPVILPRRRSPWEYVGWAVFAFLAVSLAENMLTNDRWNWPIVWEYLFDPEVLRGLRNTIWLTLLAGATGTLLGVVIALMRLSGSPLLRTLGGFYVTMLRAIPAIVLILMTYFAAAVFPTLGFGIPFGPSLGGVPTNTLITQFGAAWLALTLIMASHCGEIIRGGIMAVPVGQTEAAKALGMGPVATYRKVIFPQAVRVSIPALANELITLFKNTSLVSVIGYAELLTVVQYVYGRNYQTVPLLTVAVAWYLVLTTISMAGQRRLEKRYGKGYAR